MKERTGILLCLLASFLWGMAFVAQSNVTGVIGALSFNGIRMMLGFVVLLPMTLKILKRHKGDKKYYRALISATLACGIPLFIATNLQQWGIEDTTAGKAAFITSLYTLIVPFLSVILKRKVGLRSWICVTIGLVGAYKLTNLAFSSDNHSENTSHNSANRNNNISLIQIICHCIAVLKREKS